VLRWNFDGDTGHPDRFFVILLDKMAEHVACIGEKRNAHRFLVGKLERKRPL
jgi:hypothetical protein